MCACTDGYGGVNCETDACQGADNPCGEHGNCVHGGDHPDPLSPPVTCECDVGYSGDDCSSEVCASHPCLHGGSCSGSAGGFLCACVAGFSGATCADDVCVAANDACGVHGTCQPAALGSYHCVCAPGWEGAGCDQDINECLQTPPVCGTGQCTNTDGSFDCACNSPYFGTTCQLNYCDYDGAFCQNGGVLPGCKDPHLPSPWACACAAGYTGKQCEKGPGGGRGGGGRGGG